MSDDHIKIAIQNATKATAEKQPVRKINKGECIAIIRAFLATHGKLSPERFKAEAHSLYPKECLKIDGSEQKIWTKTVQDTVQELGRLEAWTGARPFPFVPVQNEGDHF